MDDVIRNVLELIGNTSLVRIASLSDAVGCQCKIYMGVVESVKERHFLFGMTCAIDALLPPVSLTRFRISHHHR
jgi:hypothetical protein